MGSSSKQQMLLLVFETLVALQPLTQSALIKKGFLPKSNQQEKLLPGALGLALIRLLHLFRIKDLERSHDGKRSGDVRPEF